MQCPSCQFENMPGSSHCARCAASLTLRSAEIDVNPPRASKLQRRLPARPLAAARRGTETLRSLFTTAIGLGNANIRFHGTLKEYLALLIPGMHQRSRGDWQRGNILLFVFLALLALTLVFAGTGPGSLLLGLMFAWHVIATVDAVAHELTVPLARLRLTVIAALGVLTLVYLPSILLIQQVATPMNIATPTQHFNTGDVVWYNQSLTPHAGDLVLYTIPTVGATARQRSLFPTRYRIGGLRINRLVATAGQTVRIADGKLLVDGLPSPWQPGRNALLPAECDMVVRPDHVFILPEDLLPGDNLQLNPQVSQRLAMVPARSVHGPLIARTFPLTRIRLY